MSSSDLTDDVLAARIHDACEARSTGLAVGDRPFDAGPTAPAGLPLAPSGRPGHRVLLAAAAIAVIGALVAAIVLIRPDDGSDVIRSASTAPSSTTQPETVLPAPAGERWLAPSAPPLDLSLRSVAWRHQPALDAQLGQLFHPSDDEGALLVLVAPSTGTSGMPADATVRGQPASVMPSKEDGDRSTTINWSEDGVTLEARFIGMDLDRATEILATLRWRSSDRSKGFDPPADRSTFLMNDARPDAVLRSAELEYADSASSQGVGVGTQIAVHTTVSKEPTLALLQSDFLDTDGGGTDGVRRSYDDEFGTLTTSWVDENGWNAAWIDANKTGVTEAQLRAVADSLVPTDEAGLRALEHPMPAGDAATTTTAAAGSAPSGDPLAARFEQLDGTTVSLGELASGRPMLVVLWQTTCVPCIPTIAALDEQAWAHPDRAVVLVAVEDDIDQVRQFVDEHRVTLPVLLDEGGDLLRDWDVSALPTTVALTADGTRGRTFVGALDDGAAGQAFLDQFFAS